MKKLILVMIALLLAFGAYTGYREIRRSRLLGSGRDVLLVNKQAGVYSFTSLMEADDITRAYKTIGYTEDLSEEKIRKHIEGLSLAGTTFRFPSAESLVVTPNASQQTGWNQALQSLTADQRGLCDQLQRADDVQACLFRHYIYQLLASQNVQGCSALFVDSFIQECSNIVSNNLENAVQDMDNDTLIDQYEFLADPESFDADPLN